MNKLFVISSSPHVIDQEHVKSIMYGVVLALLPVIGASIYFFGLRAILLLMVCIVFSLLSEYVFQLIRGHQPITIVDGSALITGILLGLILPPNFPLWAAALGAVVAIVMGKMVFGGLGFNIFNPALVGRAFLQATFPVLITTWSAPVQRFASFDIPVITQATPLAAMKFQNQFMSYQKLFMGNISGSLGETSVLAILLGGGYILYKKYADWRIVGGIFCTTILFSGILWLIDPTHYADPLFHLLSGGFMLGTFFMATDMVTSPVTPKGRWIFGGGIGLLIVLIRSFSGLPEGVMYAILLMNGISPLIDQYTRPRVLGQTRALRSQSG